MTEKTRQVQRKQITLDLPVETRGPLASFLKGLALRRIYDQVPTSHCKGLCHETCNNIPAQAIETERIFKKHGIQLQPMGQCPALTEDKKCGVYEDRPLVCRLWGSSTYDTLRCPHGCEPDEWLTREDCFLLLSAVQYLDGKLTLAEFEHVNANMLKKKREEENFTSPQEFLDKFAEQVKDMPGVERRALGKFLQQQMPKK
ncbi:YkgJ family cysteine cluster protein [Longispora urticae]